MKQSGIIKSLNGDKAKVVIERQASCGDCTACRLGSDDMSMEVEAINLVDGKPGDLVEIDMEHQNVLAAAFIVYMIPMFTLVVGVIGGNFVLGKMGIVEYKEIGSALIGFLLTFITFLAIKSKEESFKSNKDFVPVISGIINK